MTEIPPSLTALTTYLLSRTGKIARSRIGARLAERDLRMWHMAVLAALADAGPGSGRALAATLGVDPSDIAKILDELTVRGWTGRTRDPADRRRLLAEITPAGRLALAALTADAEAVQDRLLAPLSPAERAVLHGLLLRVFTAADG
ncbi:MarR family winged helix-turn-helix transcriptional regulator [Nonomuraea sp. NBC_01738]|uniref:MarR family winged helix-turn-helix transcriptional regulator n=1 Tax=Nonomuraea sp. NBC_01738 TaxID=2976003 RepID=UPI002E100E29|nr:MarR family winged helix-turn-helix transcriptional regulator [Nonomuraea sp. NBC_01738]